MVRKALIIVPAASAPFRAVELVVRGFIPGRRRGMNLLATSQTRLKPTVTALPCAIGLNDDHYPPPLKSPGRTAKRYISKNADITHKISNHLIWDKLGQIIWDLAPEPLFVGLINVCFG
jgi:hypothetical protein